MRRIVLGTNAIIAQPSTGSFSAPDTQFVLPTSVVGELLDSPTKVSSSYSSLLNQMVDSGTAQVVAVPPGQVTWQSEGPVLRLSQVDQDVLAVAHELRRSHPQDDVVIASDDGDMDTAARGTGLRVLSSNELSALLRGSPQDTKVKERAASVVSYERRHLFWSFLSGVAAATAATFVVRNLALVAATAHVWGTIVVLPVAGIGLFWVRARQRLGYGIAEFGVGLVAALAVFLPSFRLPQFGVSVAVHLIGGLYIMVRGLDNVGTGLRGTATGLRWKRWFPE